MSFLHPKFLWALLFMAVPLIIHLFHFRRYKRILFSNTKFLNEIKDEQATKNKLRHLLVLASRMLAVMFLVFAFAQPFIPTNNIGNANEKLISIYLDNSFSMQAEGNGTLLFDEAKTSAQKLIEAYAENNKFQILTNDFEAKHQRIVSKTEALNLLKEVNISAASQQKQLVLDKQNVGANKFEGQKIFYQLSDFQINNDLFEGDTLTQINLVKLTPTNVRNINIDSVWMEAPIQLKNQNNKLLVKITNQSDEEKSGSFQLSLNGEAKSIGNYTIAANSYVVDTLQFTITEENWNKGKISINDYPLTFDDNYFFTFYVENQMNVYCIYESDGDKYPKAVFSNNEQVKYTSNTLNSMNYNTLKDQHLVIVSNLKNIPSGLNEALKSYLEAGGQMLLIPNNESSLPSYNQFLNALNVGRFIKKNNVSTKVNKINFQHEVLNDIFDELPRNLKLPTVNQYFELNNSVKQNDILSFANGTNYLSSSSVANGNIYILSSALGDSYSDFTQQAIFAPMLYKMAVLGVKNINIAYPIEANTSVYLNKLPKNAESLIRMSNEKIEIIPQKSIYNGILLLNFPGDALSNGFYTINNDEEDYRAEVALNYNRNESMLNYFSVEEMKEKYTGMNVNILENNLASLSENVKLLEEGKSFWKICLILALIFIAIEILLLRFLPN